MRNPISSIKSTVTEISPTDVLHQACINPVTATVSASAQILTNPFRKNRRSFRGAYNTSRFYSLFYSRTHDAVKACDVCDAKVWGVETKFIKAGSRRPFDYSNDPKLQERDTFCADHKADAFKCQEIYRNRHH